VREAARKSLLHAYVNAKVARRLERVGLRPVPN
jgi:hypothetical protein